MAMFRMNPIFVAQRMLRMPSYLISIRKAHEVVNMKKLVEETESLYSIFNNKDKISAEQWQSVRESVSRFRSVNETNIDVTIMNLCKYYGNVDHASSYVDFLRTNNFDMNLGIILKYLNQFILRRNPLTELEKKEICDMYDSIREKHHVLDCITAETCILALCLTKRWQESEQLLEMIKLTTQPNGKPYSAIIIAAFNNDDPETGWKYMYEVSINLKPQTYCYLAYINYCVRNFKDVEELKNEFSKLFQLWGDNYVRVQQNAATALLDNWQKFNWIGAHSSINSNGICKQCSQKLEQRSLTSKEFEYLSTVILKNVIVGNDSYRNTTPAELKTFIELVESTKPYDMVIDGLNIAYGQGTKSPKVLARQLRLVVQHFVDRKKKLLVIGRKHMNKWPQRDINYIKQNASVFLANNLTQDDPYLLYATIASGQSTQFLSKDLMRGHRYLLENAQMKFLFKQWQVSHQCVVSWVNHKSGEVKIENGLKYHPTAQECRDGWHIPYNNDIKLGLRDTYEPPKSWLCLKFK